MLGSMYSAVSGLQTHQTKMNVIGNNIANVNTYGFKSSRVTFSDVFYQTISGASAPRENGGGTNASQMGYGSKVSSVDVIHTRAGSATTDRALDIYINGDGYLPVKDSNGIVKYTRVGVLNFDESGNLVDTNGNMVLGFQLTGSDKKASLSSDGTTGITNLEPIKISQEELKKYLGISIGQNGELTGIKEGDPTITPAAGTGQWMTSATASTDALYSGNLNMSVSREFAPDTSEYSGPAEKIVVSSNANIDTETLDTSVSPEVPYPLEVTYSAPSTYRLTYFNGTNIKDVEVTLDSNTSSNTVTFTGIDDVDGGNTGTLTIPITTDPSATAEGYYFDDGDTIDIGDVDLNNYNLTISTFDKSGQAVTIDATWDGSTDKLTFSDSARGKITIEVDPTKLQEEFDNGFNPTIIGNIGPGPGQPEKIAHLASVNFINPDGLTQSGEGYYVESTNSGGPVATIPGNGGTGTFRSGALEMSNVDLSREFTEMIIAQRGFQANTRMITVSDEMLSELVSMKR